MSAPALVDRWIRLTPWITGALCAIWAFIGWIAVIPNQDILVDGIQAQSLVFDPRVVLAFPGQKHGGPLEYPATVLFEWLLPGNYYANAAIRVVLAFLTGYVVGRLGFTLFPGTRPWLLIAAVAVGPTIIHGLQLPGVWWLQPNYDMAWLLISSGALVLARTAHSTHAGSSRARQALGALGAGLLFGLGLYAHPVSILFAVPIAVLAVLVSKASLRIVLWSVLGAAIGLLPGIVSYFVNDEVNVWDPSHKPFIYPAWLWGMGRRALGLDGIGDPATALLPHAMGFSPTQEPFSGAAQSIAVGLLLVTCLVTAVRGGVLAWRRRSWPSPATGLALAWLSAAATMVGFITSADPVWHYSAGLAVLTWISIGALPSLMTRRRLGLIVSIAWIAVLATSSWAQNRDYLSTLPERVTLKQETLTAWHQTAEGLTREGVEVIFGSYVDAVPIGYVSNWGLRTLTLNYNRFPLSPSEQERQTYQVAVREDAEIGIGEEALALIRESCTLRREGFTLPAGTYTLASCPVEVLAGPFGD